MEPEAPSPTETTPPEPGDSLPATHSLMPEASGPDLPPPSDLVLPAPRMLALPAVVALCLTMLTIGLLIGYTGHPLVAGWIATPTLTPSPSPTATVIAPDPAQPTQISEAELAQRRAELMEYVVANTRHFRGNPEASVTLIEFSDFQ